MSDDRAAFAFISYSTSSRVSIRCLLSAVRCNGPRLVVVGRSSTPTLKWPHPSKALRKRPASNADVATCSPADPASLEEYPEGGRMTPTPRRRRGLLSPAAPYLSSTCNEWALRRSPPLSRRKRPSALSQTASRRSAVPARVRGKQIQFSSFIRSYRPH
ncbi:hypothetical protein FKP32DRAFT_425877 [Trametes sanguinea]|nr:hypothetical protein FKP32DRAFT_425877 [Trametes sanguinea]